LGDDEKTFSIKQLRTDATRREWKSFDVRNLRIRRDIPVKLDIAGDMNELLVSSSDRTVSFDLNVRQRFKEQLSEKKAFNLSTEPGKTIRMAPTDWNRLEKSDLAIMAAKHILEPTATMTAAFRITDISYEKRISTDLGTTLKISWQGEARFPVTVKYRPKPDPVARKAIACRSSCISGRKPIPSSAGTWFSVTATAAAVFSSTKSSCGMRRAGKRHPLPRRLNASHGEEFPPM